MAVSTTKLLIVALLGVVALSLASFMLTLHVLVLQKGQELLVKGNNGHETLDTTKKPGPPITSNSIAPSLPTSDLYLWKRFRTSNITMQRAYTSKSRVNKAESYWNTVKKVLTEWDATLQSAQPVQAQHHVTKDNEAISSSMYHAAQLGHPDAHYYYAVALASGISPATGTPLSSHGNAVKDDIWTMDSDTTLAYLHWHFAAMEGNIEASQALAYRLKHSQTCQAALPYFEAAAHGIIDQLEANIHSRAKITPPMDKHALPEIYTHGGTSSQLALENKPNESPEAIQYYHLRATQHDDVHAAYVLGNLYHYGMRGVEHNMTMALFYYEMAANAGHWEAAGQAGKCHIWSLGIHHNERNLLKAQKYFHLGAPYGLEGCRNKFRNAIKKKSKRPDDNTKAAAQVCDHPSLNGLGLLHLYGIPMIVSIDVEKAKQYFILARDMGNMDASYNLAMLRLGWKHAWKNAKLKNGVSVVTTSIPEFMPNTDTQPISPNAADYAFAFQEFVNAANKGHLQARHRLAMMYQHGVTLPGHTKPTVKSDCAKAMLHYQWILDHASIPWSQRTRLAYDYYMQGNLEGALKNYMMAAETGHAMSQVNAAFLLERGICLGLSKDDCRKASLRYWKAAAQQGHAEAAIRVGDFYYFGDKLALAWLRPILFPEKLLLPMLSDAIKAGFEWIRVHGMGRPPTKTNVCNSANNELQDQQCLASDRSDLTKAAHYYRLASEQHKSPRAHFNLGFMHEWGLGLKKDFPLAKRHYDFAQSSSSNHGEADFVVPLALLAMRVHEWTDQVLQWWKGSVV